MQFLGRLLDTVSSVSTLFTNPYRVREVPLSDYGGGGKVKLKEEGRIVLYKYSQSWDCLLLCPETPNVALRSVLITSIHCSVCSADSDMGVKVQCQLQKHLFCTFSCFYQHSCSFHPVSSYWFTGLAYIIITQTG